MASQTTPEPISAQVLRCLHKILERAAETSAKIAYPGEGGERSFRHWLASDFLEDLLRWSPESVIVGEKFDILLLDSERFPVITIETKPPGHRATKKDLKDFRNRLTGFGTLKTAYFTDGSYWERLDIFLEGGELRIRLESKLALSSATLEEAEAFFGPLAVDRYFGGQPRENKQAVARDHAYILHALAADLDSVVSDLVSFFGPLFEGFRSGEGGPAVTGVTLALFDMWCEKSLLVPPRETVVQLLGLAARKGNEPPSNRDYETVLRELGLPHEGSQRAAENLASLPRGDRVRIQALREAIWPAYEQAVGSLAAQTAHVILGRALLYRIGEDQGVFPVMLSGAPLAAALKTKAAELGVATAALELLSRVRSSMESFLSTVYMLGEFDWWLVSADERAPMTRQQVAWLHVRDQQFERVLQRMLRTLDGYSFERVDVDVWRNVYQEYLPAEERQKLGGFYTHDILVNLILDLCEFTARAEGLCSLSFLDPACGSGAFVTGALGRLLEHLSLKLQCHIGLNSKGIPEWKRAEQIVRLCAERLHAIDIHPFAAFLTTVNVLFLLLPYYVQARRRDPEFSIDLRIFSADSLEKPDAELLEPELFAQANARVQLTKDSYRRYQRMLSERFDCVIGNPPWGGVLKGRLAPVYNTVKKRRFAKEYPAAARGKYDVFGLFMERALHVLRPGGRFGLLTQGTFLDKEWAAGLRKALSGMRVPGSEVGAVRSRLRFIIDLNPFGGLFFQAMNSPCITIGDAVTGDTPVGECIGLLASAAEFPRGTSKQDRRELVDAVVRATLKEVAEGRKPAAVRFARARLVPLSDLRTSATSRWNLDEPAPVVEIEKTWPTAAEVLEMRQGVTPGGCLDVFLLTSEQSSELRIEAELTRPAIKSKNLDRWRVTWGGQILFYPYRVGAGKAMPAFALDPADAPDQRLGGVLGRAGVTDSLDFDHQLDDRERAIVGKQGLNRSSVEELLRHRIALGIVRYPLAAAYLVKHYERLEGRIFKHRNIRRFGRQWYEYLWPRDVRLMLKQERIVSPTLVREVRFALDTHGYLSDHACLYLQPTLKTHARWTELRKALSETLGRTARERDGLEYCLAFLNSQYAQASLTRGQRPTPKGSYALTEAKLREIPIPPPRPGRDATEIVHLVDGLATGRARNKEESESRLAELTNLARYR